jgi:hypothetical protein
MGGGDERERGVSWRGRQTMLHHETGISLNKTLSFSCLSRSYKDVKKRKTKGKPDKKLFCH